MEEDSDRRLEKRERWMMLIVLAVFLIGLPAIFVLPAEKILFNPDNYKQALAEQNVYAQFPEMVGQMIAEGGNVFLFGSGDQLMRLLQKSNYDAIIREIFTKEWVQDQANGLIDQFWVYFNLHSPDFKLLVDFRPVKTRLSGDQSPQIAAAIVQGFPPCKGDEILNFGMQVLNGTVDQLPLCKPPDMLLGAADLVAQGALKGTAEAMPDQLDLAAVLRLPAAVGGGPVSGAWKLWFQIYRTFRRVDLWLPWLSLLLLTLMAWASWRTPRGPVFWVGTALILPGVAALLIALVFGLLSGVLLPNVIARLFGRDLIVFDLLVAMLAKVSGTFMLWSAIAAWGVLIIGCGMLVAWRLTRRNKPVEIRE